MLHNFRPTLLRVEPLDVLEWQPLTAYCSAASTSPRQRQLEPRECALLEHDTSHNLELGHILLIKADNNKQSRTMPIPSFPSADEPHIRAALDEVAAYEPGDILNDHYTPEFYAKRRVHFLGSHPEYAHRQNGLFAITSADAHLVFGADDYDLSVQEVRRRELTQGIVPFLPLPTTGNTDTITNYDGLPDREWTEGIEIPQLSRSSSTSSTSPFATSPGQDISNVGRSRTNAGRRASGARSTPMSPRDVTDNTLDTEDATPPTSPVDSISDAPRRRTKQSATNVSANATKMQQTASAVKTVRSQPKSSRAAVTVRQTVTMAKTNALIQVPQNDNRHLIEAIIARLGKEAVVSGAPTGSVALPKDPTPARDTANGLASSVTGRPSSSGRPAARYSNGFTTEASALSNRATNTPVKRKRGTGPPIRPGDNVEEISTDGEGDTEDEEDDSQAPPAKRPKIKLRLLNSKPKPENAAPKSAPKSKAKPKAKTAAADTANAPSKKKKQAQAPGKSVPMPKSKAKTTAQKTTAQQATTSLAPHIQAIVTGATLPTTPEEAREADDARHTLLLAHHNRLRRARKRKAETEPDMMPEYFETANFPAGAEQDQVRCLCGAITDDEQFVMVACDECGVWQHNHCAGPAGLVDPPEGDYFCQNCDPWAHRVAIQAMRRANVITG